MKLFTPDERIVVSPLEVAAVALSVAYLVAAGSSFAASALVAGEVLVRDFVEGVLFWALLQAVLAFISFIGSAAGRGADDDVAPPVLPADAVVVSRQRGFLIGFAENALFLMLLLVPGYAILGPAGLASLAGITFTVVAFSAPGVASEIWRCRRTGRSIFVAVGFRPFRASKRYVRKVNATRLDSPASA